MGIEKNSVCSVPIGLPVFGSSGKLGMQDFGTESAAHHRQVCLIFLLYIYTHFCIYITFNLFFKFFTGQHQQVVFISFLSGTAALLLCSLSLLLSLLLSLTLSLSLSLWLGMENRNSYIPFHEKEPP